MALVDSSSAIASTSGKSHHSRRFSGVFSSFFDAFRCYVPQGGIGGSKLGRSSSRKREIPSGDASQQEQGGGDKSSRACTIAAASSDIRPRRLNLKQIIQKDEEDEALEQQMVLRSTIKRDLKLIVEQLEWGDQQDKAAAQIRKLTRDSAENREHLADLGALPLLVKLLDSAASQAGALLALLNLAIGNNKNKAEIVACGAVPKIVSILNSGGKEEMISSAQESATATFLSLSALDSNKPVIGQSGAMLPLLRMLRHGSPQARKDAIRVLYNLSICSTNATNLANANAIPLLLELITTEEFAEKALAILGNIVATSDHGRKSILDLKQNSIDKLLAGLNFHMENAAMVDSGCSASSSSSAEDSSLGSSSSSRNTDSTLSSKCQERLLYVLMVMSHHSGAARQAMLRGGAVSPLLEVALLGSAIAQRRASRILECLREQGRSVSAPMAVVVTKEQQQQQGGSSSRRMMLGMSKSNLSSSLWPASQRDEQRRECSSSLVSEERKAVNWMVKKSLERNMEKMVRRARMPSTDMGKVKTFGTSTSSRSLLA